MSQEVNVLCAQLTYLSATFTTQLSSLKKEDRVSPKKKDPYPAPTKALRRGSERCLGPLGILMMTGES